MLLPKLLKKFLAPKRIKQRSAFRPKDNVLKDYRKRYPSEQLKQWAEERRAKQVAAKWPAELAMKAVLESLGVYAGHQFIIYYPGSFCIADFFIPARKIIIEVDGVNHKRDQPEHDVTRDAWLLKNYGMRTVRISNRTTLSNRQACEAIIRAELRL
jgi:very-short-patch-repair endonuclease